MLLLRGGRAGCQLWASRWASTASSLPDFYELLQVPPTAEPNQIKHAFRERAKQLHPDALAAAGAASGAPPAPPSAEERAAFVQLLTAYQVLGNPRSRALYDTSRDGRGPAFLREAAAEGVQQGGGYDDAEIRLGWGLGSLFGAHGDSAEQPAALDHLRRELKGDFQAALRHAYLGPRLHCQDWGSLPDAFEADERAVPDTAEVLQLVSGRQLLGVVRERRLHQLVAQQAAAALEQEQVARLADPAAAAAAPDAPGSGMTAGNSWQQGGSSAPATGVGSMASGSAAGSGAAKAESMAGRGGQAGRQQDDVLDFVLGDEVVATAIRKPTPTSSCSGGGRSGGTSGGSRPGSSQGHPAAASAPASAAAAAGGAGGSAPTAEIRFYRGDQLLGSVHEELDAAASPTASSARLLNAQGAHTHTVLRSRSPLVRNIAFIAEPASGLRTRRPSKACICRARRAWLPPSAVWLFRPRCYSHDIGGWYLEWAGERQRHHPAYLDPSLFVLTAAFDTLDYERAAQQPQGLFARLRQGDETAGSKLGWLRAALRFHGFRSRRSQ